jgi:hypothetical protein
MACRKSASPPLRGSFNEGRSNQKGKDADAAKDVMEA